MNNKMEKDADSMVVKNVEYAASEYSASSEPPPVSKAYSHDRVKFTAQTKSKKHKLVV